MKVLHKAMIFNHEAFFTSDSSRASFTSKLAVHVEQCNIRRYVPVV